MAHFLNKRGYVSRRGQQFAGRSKGGEEAPDVISTLPDDHIEVKRTETLSVYKAMEQACADAPEGSVPTVWHRRNGKEWLVIIRAEDYIDLKDKALENSI